MSEPSYGRSHSSPFVGRQDELAFLRQLLWSVEHNGEEVGDTDNRRTCVFLEADAGIGKTRLVEEISTLAESRAWTVLWSRAAAHEKKTPYWLWVKLLHTILEEGLWSPTAEDPPLHLFSSLISLLPELAELLPPDTLSRPEVPRQMLPHLQEALLAVFSSMSADAHLLLVIDDLHWLDDTSCEMLELLAHRIHAFPMLIVGTYRETESVQQQGPLRALIASLQRDHSDSILHLDRLQDADIKALVSSIRPLPETQVHAITQLAEGVPFFAEELAFSDVSLPFSTTLTSALDVRIRYLSTACQQFLSRLSVLGGAVALPVLLAMESSLADSSEDILFELLEEALKAKILVEEETGPYITYHFWHGLFARHLYERLSKARCAKLHRHGAAVLQQVYAAREDEWAATIVYHLITGAGDLQETFRYALIAADRAYRLSAYPEAAHHYRLALTTIEEATYHLDDLRLLPQEDLWLSVSTLSERLAECCAAQGEFAAARRLYEEVLHQWTRKHDEVQASVQYQAQMTALLWCEIAWTWYDEGLLVRASECCEQGHSLLHIQAVQDGPALARLRFCQASIFWREGASTSARDAGYEALRLFEDALRLPSMSQEERPRTTRISRTLVGDPVDLARVHALLGPFLVANGQVDEALPHLQGALTIFEEQECSREVAHTCCNLADVYMKKKDYSIARVYLHRAQTLAERGGDTPLLAAVIGNLGIIELDEGKNVEAEMRLQQAMKLSEQVHDLLLVSSWLVYLACAYAELKRFPDALVAVGRALTLARTMKNRPCTGQSLLVLGMIRLAQAIALSESLTFSSEHRASLQHPLHTLQLLKRARSTLQHAFLYPIEEEFRAKGELALKHVVRRLEQQGDH